ncbi:MAG: hypothetical protein WAV20_18300 [Blastocatellia bacterium]
MRTNVNLARRPFTNHRLFWVVLLAVYFISLWTFFWIAGEKSRVIAKASETKQRIEGQKQMAADAILEQERRKQEQQKIVLTERQALELAAARQLIARKVFSWNRMIGDIEEFVPKNTRIMSIRVDEIASDANRVMARVEVKAVGTTPDEMTQMMLNLEKSGGLFTVGEAGQETTTENGETPFALTLTYQRSRGEAQ